MNKQLFAGAAAATAAIAVALVVQLAPGECADVVAVVMRKTDAGQEYKAQVNYRVCGVADGGLDHKLPEGAQVILVRKPYATSSKSTAELADDAVHDPCACASQLPDAKPCEALIAGRDGKEEWGKPPAATVLQPGRWRGDGCLHSICEETPARESCGGAGCLIRKECKPQK